MELANGRSVVVDLTSGKVEQRELEDESLLQRPFPDSLKRKVADEHGPDALIIGSGLLCGSLVPAACAGYMMLADPQTREVAPLLGFAGVELKLSGFDLIVVKGRAPEPGYIWARDGIAEFVRSPDLKSLDSWGRTDRVREQQGDRRIQVLTTGWWGDAGADSSQLVVNYWGGEDKHALGSELGKRNLMAVALRGMGELEVQDPEEHFKRCVSLRMRQLEALGENRGIASYSNEADRPELMSLVHRHSACFGCPYPCRSFVKIHEDPREMKLGHKEPGYLLYDIPALEKALFLGLGMREIVEVLSMCARRGAEPISVFSRCRSLEEISSLLETPQPLGELESLNGAIDSGKDSLELMALGLCPRYWAKAGVDMSAISDCVEPALGRPLPR